MVSFCLKFVYYLLLVTVIESKLLTLQLTTWNVNIQPPYKSGDLDILLGLGFNLPIWTPDIIAIGLQEGYSDNAFNILFKNYLKHLIDSKFETPESFLKNNEMDDETKWTRALRNTAEYWNYYEVGKANMFGIIVVVFAKLEHWENIDLNGKFKEPAGFGNIFPNKGGVGLNMNIYRTPFTFVVSHLPDGDYKVHERLAVYNKINNRLEEFDEDYIFWMGDLNFRLKNFQLSAEDINELLDNGFTKELLTFDELISMRTEHKIFDGYEESNILFRPTYRYYVGTNVYDLKRRPAWTDRILYKIKKYRKAFKKIYYRDNFFYDNSDHKPVQGRFRLFVKTV